MKDKTQLHLVSCAVLDFLLAAHIPNAKATQHPFAVAFSYILSTPECVSCADMQPPCACKCGCRQSLHARHPQDIACSAKHCSFDHCFHSLKPLVGSVTRCGCLSRVSAMDCDWMSCRTLAFTVLKSLNSHIDMHTATTLPDKPCLAGAAGRHKAPANYC